MDFFLFTFSAFSKPLSMRAASVERASRIESYGLAKLESGSSKSEQSETCTETTGKCTYCLLNAEYLIIKASRLVCPHRAYCFPPYLTTSDRAH